MDGTGSWFDPNLRVGTSLDVVRWLNVIVAATIKDC
jgi:hypothetical protein